MLDGGGSGYKYPSSQMNFDFQPIDIDFYLIDGILTNISEKMTAYARQAKSLKPDEKMSEPWIDGIEKMLYDYKTGLVEHKADNSIVTSIDNFGRKIRDICSVSDFAKEADVFVYQINNAISEARNKKNGNSYISMPGVIETAT